MRSPFDRVVVEHGAVVLRVCRAVLGVPADAEDAWSETFLAALRAWPDLPETANVQAWLVTIAHRKAVDVTRVRRPGPLPAPELLEASPAPADGFDLDRWADREELWSAVATLPAKQRRTVAYHYLAGLPYAEVAELVGGTPAAARRAAADGVAALRRLLASDPEGVSR